MIHQYYKGFHDIYYRGNWYSSFFEKQRRRDASECRLDDGGPTGLRGDLGGVCACESDRRIRKVV